MSISVNLLPSGAKFQAKKTKFRKYAGYFSIAFISLYIAMTMVITGINVSANSRLKASQKKYQQSQSVYESLGENIAMVRELKFQSKLVGKALGERFEYGSAFKRISGLFSDLKVAVLDYQLVKGSTFRLSGTADSGESMDSVEKKVADMNQGLVEGIDKASLTGLTVTGNSWKFDLEVTIK